MKKISPQSPRRRLKASFAISLSSRSDKRISQKVIDTTSRRLSEPADKFKKLQADSNIENGTFAINFFKKNPHLKDEARPEDKIKKFDQILNANCLDSSERLKVLVQKKMLVSLVYGQVSTEYLESVAALGSYYNSIHRTTSAIRNLEEAIDIDISVSNSMEESMKIRIELAEAYLNLPCAKKSELVRNTNKALNTIKQYSDVVTDDPKTNYRKSHILGKIAFRKNDFSESIERYNESLAFLEDINNGQETAETANLFFEIGKVCSKENLAKTACDYYQKAYDIFESLNMHKQASVLEPLLPTGEEFDLVYGNENEEESVEQYQVNYNQKNQNNDSSNESRSSAYKNVEGENNNSNESATDPMKFYFNRPNNQIQNENNEDSNKSNSNENSTDSFNKDNVSQNENDTEDNRSSEIDVNYNKSIENQSESKDSDKPLSENSDDENDLTQSEIESEKSDMHKSRPEQFNYQVEIEEDENEGNEAEEDGNENEEDGNEAEENGNEAEEDGNENEEDGNENEEDGNENEEDGNEEN